MRERRKLEKKLSMSDFSFQKVIGEGSYGRALLCRSRCDNQLVVIKEIALKNLSEQEQRDAWKETKVLSLMNHPNIIRYYGSFLEQGVLHIVMEYADNGDLSEKIKNANSQHFNEEQILDWFVQICLALKHLHDRKILHRDLKCQNIFLLKDGTAKLGDFGISKMLDTTTQMSKTAIGTPYYLSPEICQGKPYDQKSDIWSLGCILYELSTLHHPFDSNCLNGLIVKIQRAKQPPIPYFYSQNLRKLVDTLLQKVPSRRPTVNQILEIDFIRVRISNFLSSTIKRKEFCHTVFHHAKPGETPPELQDPPKNDINVKENHRNENIKNNKYSNRRNRVQPNENVRDRFGFKPKLAIKLKIPENINEIDNQKYNVQSPRGSTPSSPRNSRPSSPAGSRPSSPRGSRPSSPRSIPKPSTPRYNQQQSNLQQNSSEPNGQNNQQEVIEQNPQNELNEPQQQQSNKNNNNERKSKIKGVVLPTKLKPRIRSSADVQKNNRKSIPKEDQFLSKAEILQARKSAMVHAERASAKELKAKREQEERQVRIRNEIKRQEVLERAKRKGEERRQQMKKLEQEAREQKERYNNLKPSFKINRKQIKKNKKNEESEKIQNNTDENTDAESNLKKNRTPEEEHKALKEFIAQRRKEMRLKKERDDIILVGNIEVSVKRETEEKRQISNKRNDEAERITNEINDIIYNRKSPTSSPENKETQDGFVSRLPQTPTILENNDIKVNQRNKQDVSSNADELFIQKLDKILESSSSSEEESTILESNTNEKEENKDDYLLESENNTNKNDLSIHETISDNDNLLNSDDNCDVLSPHQNSNNDSLLNEKDINVDSSLISENDNLINQTKANSSNDHIEDTIDINFNNESIIQGSNNETLSEVNSSLISDSEINPITPNENKQYNDSNDNNPYNDSNDNNPFNDTNDNTPFNDTNDNTPLNDGNDNNPFNDSNDNDPYNDSNDNNTFNDSNDNNPFNDNNDDKPFNNSNENKPYNGSNDNNENKPILREEDQTINQNDSIIQYEDDAINENKSTMKEENNLIKKDEMENLSPNDDKNNISIDEENIQERNILSLDSDHESSNSVKDNNESNESLNNVTSSSIETNANNHEEQNIESNESKDKFNKEGSSTDTDLFVSDHEVHEKDFDDSSSGPKSDNTTLPPKDHSQNKSNNDENVCLNHDISSFCNSKQRLMINGNELKLDSDSLPYKTEVIRQFIENGLGTDKFITVYNFYQSHEDDKANDLLNTTYDKAYIFLIHQLIQMEEYII